MTPTNITCLCGAVKVQIHGDAIAQFYCHCNDCQATSGGAYIGLALYPADAVTILHGDMDTWTLRQLPRQRCAVCGTHVLAYVPEIPAYGIKANLLPPGVFKPEFHIQCQDALLPVKDALPHFKGFPASFGGTDEQVEW